MRSGLGGKVGWVGGGQEIVDITAAEARQARLNLNFGTEKFLGAYRQTSRH